MTTNNLKKSIRSLVVTGLLIFGCSYSAFCQMELGRLNLGAELNVPIGYFSTYARPGIGFSAKYEAAIPTLSKLNWTASAGYIWFHERSIAGYNNNYHFGMIPLQGGVKYYLTDRYTGLYGSAELGLTVSTFGGGRTVYGDAGTTQVSFAPGAGYQMGPWDFSARLQLLNNNSYFSMRAAYVINLKR